MMNHEIIIAGFGGQGVLFAGKLLVYTGMIFDKAVSWLPSYGPEMRGGTCNCHIILNDTSVGSPYVVNPTEAIILNKPSFEKFEASILPGGKLFYDSSLCDNEHKRDDIEYIGIPATTMAYDMNASKLANMIITGKVLKETGMFNLEDVFTALSKLIPPKRAEMLEINKKAIENGFNY
ncbi:MAG: 2-oxoacid:ferredoxin oxidoreductase subunit gamma [Ruminococcaceae bacterium]|nr:2-oxoacid:ferredoxin oxidoreductase subunit gamma [Oscillospiraceae bacterium]